MATDIVDILLQEHQDFVQLFDDLEQAPPADREERFRYLVARLASHEAAEEALVHRTVRRDVPGGERVAEEVLAEEAEAEQLLADMGDLDPTTTEFMSALERLRIDVLAHATHEEVEEFPLIREHLDAERRRELGESFIKVRDAGPTRPHPGTPQNPTVRAMAGPVVGFFDRARDVVRDAFGDDGS